MPCFENISQSSNPGAAFIGFSRAQERLDELQPLFNRGMSAGKDNKKERHKMLMGGCLSSVFTLRHPESQQQTRATLKQLGLVSDRSNDPRECVVAHNRANIGALKCGENRLWCDGSDILKHGHAKLIQTRHIP